MRCTDATQFAEAYADDEVRGLRRVLLRRHLRGCPGCAARVDEALALKRRIRAECVRFTAPAGLRARLLARRETSKEVPRESFPRRRPWAWAGGGALAGSLFTLVVWVVASGALDRRTQDDLAVALVDAHVRATLANELTQVASTDQHTVKPWLSARLDYSPPVRDFAVDGFPLAGARIERVNGRDVATLVYRYRLHTVDVFVRPDSPQLRTDELANVRGFNVLHGTGQGMHWTLVSDASVESLAPLLRALTGR